MTGQFPDCHHMQKSENIICEQPIFFNHYINTASHELIVDWKLLELSD